MLSNGYAIYTNIIISICYRFIIKIKGGNLVSAYLRQGYRECTSSEGLQGAVNIVYM